LHCLSGFAGAVGYFLFFEGLEIFSSIFVGAGNL